MVFGCGGSVGGFVVGFGRVGAGGGVGGGLGNGIWLWRWCWWSCCVWSTWWGLDCGGVGVVLFSVVVVVLLLPSLFSMLLPPMLVAMIGVDCSLFLCYGESCGRWGMACSVVFFLFLGFYR